MAMCERQVLALLQTKDLIGDDIEMQTDQALKNLGAILEAAGSSYSQVLKTTVLLTDMGDFAKVNNVYGESFHRKQGTQTAPLTPMSIQLRSDYPCIIDTHLLSPALCLQQVATSHQIHLRGRALQSRRCRWVQRLRLRPLRRYEAAAPGHSMI